MFMDRVFIFVIVSLFVPVAAAPQRLVAAVATSFHHEAVLPTVATNDNRMPAGTLTRGMLTLELRTGLGTWRPLGDSGPMLTVEAFGEAGKSLSAPAPLIRVPEGAELAVSVRNELDSTLRVHGLCERGGVACAPFEVAAGEARQIRFTSGRAGTYLYWATTTGAPLQFRGSTDSQLSGAFIVDPSGAEPDADRIFVITEWTSLTRTQLKELATQDDPGASFLQLRPEVMFLINGLAWPHTERLQYELRKPVRWRVINLSTQVHPMHLHGFYFAVDSVGDINRDNIHAIDQKPRVVTQVMQPGSTMTMTWKPERVGNWLFHCHVMTHVSPTLHVDESPKAVDAHDRHHAGAGMTGMVLGITITGATEEMEEERMVARPAAARKLTLVMRRHERRFGDSPALGFVLDGAGQSSPVQVPGPTLILTRGEPVEITLVNRLAEATAIHWHGMELDSYYDGVHGWSGSGQRVTPLIEPGESFVVRFTPPQSGTFIYHTHLHDHRQLSSGLYGAMLVVDPEETFDSTTDHVLVLGRGGPQPGAPTVINNERQPEFVWKAGARHRIRLINITPNEILSVSLQTNDGPVTWHPITKDGAPVPPDRCTPGPAKQIIGVGETYDFEYRAPAHRQVLWLEVRTPGGKWYAQGRVIVR